MSIRKVTFTGADDTVLPLHLLKLSVAFPEVEWGILVSETRRDEPRFPSFEWIHELVHLLSVPKAKLVPNLSLHICGRWAKQLLLGKNEIPVFLWDNFSRIQLNFNSEMVSWNEVEFTQMLFEDKVGYDHQFIFQVSSDTGNKYFDSLSRTNTFNVAPLFDKSGGLGKTPSRWPRTKCKMIKGYAGGLGPENIEEQIPLIMLAAGGQPIWIDMETKLRSIARVKGEDIDYFDLNKVHDVLFLLNSRKGSWLE